MSFPVALTTDVKFSAVRATAGYTIGPRCRGKDSVHGTFIRFRPRARVSARMNTLQEKHDLGATTKTSNMRGQSIEQQLTAAGGQCS